jgi:hypothetical protein
MELNGPGFHVAVDVVEQAANGIKQSVQDQGNFELRGLCGEADMYGHTALRDALMDFCVRTSDVIDELVDEGEEIGDALSAVASTYREVDASAVGALTEDPALDVADG